MLMDVHEERHDESVIADANSDWLYFELCVCIQHLGPIHGSPRACAKAVWHFGCVPKRKRTAIENKLETFL